MVRQKNIGMLVKPTHACQFDCAYCYDKPFREEFKNKKMTLELVDKILELTEKYAEKVHWIWHGGEATLMGIDWFKKAQELFYKHYQTQYKQSMQSNGVLLNEKWAKFCNDYEIVVGVSFDVFTQNLRQGNKTVNIADNIKRFLDAGGKVGTITVINSHNYKRQIELYEYFKREFDFDPAFNHVFSSEKTKELNLELEIDDFIHEFTNYYKHWLYDNSSKARNERSAGLVTNLIFGETGGLCNVSDCRYGWLGVNPIGDLYPCDRYVPEKYSMGNIVNYQSITDIYKSNGHLLYSMEAEKRFHTHCVECGYFDYCHGGCNGNHIYVAGDATGVDESSCNIFRKRFNTVYDILRDVDIYKNNLNPAFNNIVKKAFTLKEIKEFLQTKGFNTEFEYNPDSKNIINTQEFRIFRMFNKLNKHENFHIDYVVPVVEWEKGQSLEEFRRKRFELMECLYETKKEIILSELRGEL